MRPEAPTIATGPPRMLAAGLAACAASVGTSHGMVHPANASDAKPALVESRRSFRLTIPLPSPPPSLMAVDFAMDTTEGTGFDCDCDDDGDDNDDRGEKEETKMPGLPTKAITTANRSAIQCGSGTVKIDIPIMLL